MGSACAYILSCESSFFFAGWKQYGSMLFRRLLGAAAVYDKLLVLPSVADFYCSSLYPKDRVYDPLRGVIFNPYDYWDGSCGVAWGIHGGELVLSLLLMAGRGNGALLSAAIWLGRSWNWRRIPNVHTVGDRLLHVGMLSSALLPGRAVVDNEPAVTLLRVQMCLVYFSSVLHKVLLHTPGREEYNWLGGTAISEALRCRLDATAVGEWLAGWPQVCRLLTWMTLVVQGFACVALMCPGCLRRVALVAVTLMHIGMTFTLRLYNFMPIVFATLSIFLSTEQKKKKKKTTSSREGWFTKERREAAVFITGLLLLLTLRSIVDFHPAGQAALQNPINEWFTIMTEMFLLNEKWSMYAGAHHCKYVAAPAQLPGGGWVDLHRVHNVPGEMPHWQPNVSQPSEQPTHMLWSNDLVYQGWRCDLSAKFYCRQYPMVRRVTIVKWKGNISAPAIETCNHTCS